MGPQRPRGRKVQHHNVPAMPLGEDSVARPYLPRRAWRRGLLLLAATLVLLLGGLLLAPAGWARYQGSISPVRLALAKPQALIVSTGLARLPADLVKAPVLRELLTEDLVGYYEEHEDRLGLRGAIRRLAFERAPTLGDQVLAAALDEPAELAWWTDSKGAPRHWLLAMSRNSLAKALQGLYTLAADDRQLGLIATVRLPSGAGVDVWALQLSPRRTLALASLGDRVLVASDPGLIFDAERRATPEVRATLGQLLAEDPERHQLYRKHFGLAVGKATPPGHQLVLGGTLLSFGYQAYFPRLDALRLDLAPQGRSLRMAVRLNGDSSWAGVKPASLPASLLQRLVNQFKDGVPPRQLWTALPSQSAFCAALPADWERAAALPLAGPEAAEWSRLMKRLDGSAGLCWYARSQLHTPLLVVHLKEPGDAAAALEKITRSLMHPRAKARKLPRQGNVQRWQFELAAPWGGSLVGGRPAYRPTVAQQGQWLSFSPDEGLVDLALDAQARRFPSLADTLGGDGKEHTLAMVDPAQLATLAQQETDRVITPSQEAMRQAVQRQLQPRLQALRQLGPARAVASGNVDEGGWVTVDWLPMGNPRRPAR